MNFREQLKQAGLEPAGEATPYCRILSYAVINGIDGIWLQHEFGGEVFLPRGARTERGFRDRTCYAKAERDHG